MPASLPGSRRSRPRRRRAPPRVGRPTGTGSSGRRRVAAHGRHTSFGPGPAAVDQRSSGRGSTRPSPSLIGSARVAACGPLRVRMRNWGRSPLSWPRPSSARIARAGCWRLPCGSAAGRPSGILGTVRGGPSNDSWGGEARPLRETNVAMPRAEAPPGLHRGQRRCDPASRGARPVRSWRMQSATTPVRRRSKSVDSTSPEAASTTNNAQVLAGRGRHDRGRCAQTGSRHGRSCQLA